MRRRAPVAPRGLVLLASALLVGGLGSLRGQGYEEVLFFDARDDQTATANGGAVILPFASGLWRFWYQDVYFAVVSPDGRQIAYCYDTSIMWRT